MDLRLIGIALIILHFVVYGERDIQPVVATSLAHNIGLSGDPLRNPFYDPDIPAPSKTNRMISIKSSKNKVEKQEVDLYSEFKLNDIWISQVTAAPATINLLGQLTILSSKLDFSFETFMPNFTFQRIKYKQSFRATLMQIGNEGWQAFSKAHENMDKIQLYMQLIPTHIHTAMNALETAPSARIIERVLPRTIRELERISSICVNLTQDSRKAFLEVMELLSEVVAATAQSQGVAQQRKQATEMELNSSRVFEARLANMTKHAKETYIAAQEKTRQAYDTYKAAVRAIPVGFDKFLQDFGDAVNNVINELGPIIIASAAGGPVAGVIAALRSRDDNPAAGTSVNLGSGEGDPAANTNAQIDLVETATYADLYRLGLEKLTSDVKRSSKGTTSNTSIDPADCDHAITTFNIQLDALGKGARAEELRSLLKDGITIANELLDLSKNTMSNKTKAVQTILGRIHTLLNKVNGLAALRPPATNSGQKRAHEAKASGSNEKFVAEMALVDLQDLRAREEAYCTQWRAKEDQLTALLVKIASLDLTTINYQQLIELMSNALDLLGEISKRWGQLTQFFTTLAGRAEIVSNAMLPQLIEHFKEAGASDLRPNERSWYFDPLKKATKGIKLQSYMLFIMSRTYTDMSNKFLLPRLAGLAKLLSAKNDTMRDTMRKELDKASKKAQAEVHAFINKRHKAYLQAIRQQELENTKLVTKMGGSSKENQVAIAEGKKRRQEVGWFT